MVWAQVTLSLNLRQPGYCKNNPIGKTDPDGRGVNDNNVLPDVTCTASYPPNYDHSFLSQYQMWIDHTRTNKTNNHQSQAASNPHTIQTTTLNLPNANLTNPAPESLETIKKAIGATGVVAENVNVYVANYGGAGDCLCDDKGS